MISIIICSVNHQLLTQIKLNIDQTIGVKYEIIALNNKDAKDGICKVYNRGGEKAVFPILCFVHEDVLFDTLNWGAALIKHFKDSDIGLLGIAGGDTKGLVPSSWSSSLKSNEVNFIQHTKKGTDKGEHIFLTANNNPQVQKKVTTVDGVFLCTTKRIFSENKFDESNLKGFHGYDIDYSLQVFMSYDVVVVFDILLHHFSEGKPDKHWVDSAVIISKKWRKKLPVSVYPLSVKDFNFHHWMSLQIFLEKLFGLNYNYHQIFFYYIRYSFTKYFTIRRFLSMGKFVILSMLKKSKENKQQTLANYKTAKVECLN